MFGYVKCIHSKRNAQECILYIKLALHSIIYSEIAHFTDGSF